MALDPSTFFAPRIVAPSLDYPYGSAVDDSTGTTGDGTPLLAGGMNDWFGLMQWLLDQAGVTPSGNPDTVLASDYGDALEYLYGRAPNFVGFTASGNYIPSPGLRWALVLGVGGGGGGGGAANAAAGQAAAGGGGGGGSGIISIFPASALAALEPVTIGAAGAAGTSVGGSGGTGGTTIFKGINVGGGSGGPGSTATSATVGIQGGAGGIVTAAAADISPSGNPGAPGIKAGVSSVGTGGSGGSSGLFGGGGLGAINTATQAAGANGLYFGGGGGGGATGGSSVTGAAGGTGQPGVLVIYEHF